VAASFYVVGSLVTFAGAALWAYAWFMGYGGDGAGRVMGLMSLLPLATGGLFFLAVGGVLSRLDRLIAKTGTGTRGGAGPALD
jgi:hypothetical protein